MSHPSQTASSHFLECLPPEILDEIAFNIEKASDLLAFALTAKCFSTIVVPDHLQYWYIRADLVECRVWLHLKESPYLAKQVRCLEVGPGPFRLPTTLEQLLEWSGKQGVQIEEIHHPTDDSFKRELGRCLFGAIKAMSNLMEFKWEVEPSDPYSEHARNIFKDTDGHPDGQTLSHAFQLQKLRITCGWICPSVISRQYFHTLTHLALSRVYTPHDGDYSAISCAKSLTHLFLSEVSRPVHWLDWQQVGPFGQYTRLISSASILSLFEFATWPLLRKLSLPGFDPCRFTTDTSAFSSFKRFLARHPRLEALYLPHVNLKRDRFLMEEGETDPRNFLPNLIALSIVQRDPEVSKLASRSPTALETLDEWMPSRLARQSKYISLKFIPENIHVVGRFSSLKVCKLSGDLEALQKLVWLARQIERLHFQMTAIVPFPDSVLQVLSSLKQLTHLALVLSSNLGDPEVLIHNHLAPELGRLNYTQLLMPDTWGTESWYKVVRNTHGKFEELERLDREKIKMSKCGVEYWECFYFWGVGPSELNYY